VGFIVNIGFLRKIPPVKPGNFNLAGYVSRLRLMAFNVKFKMFAIRTYDGLVRMVIFFMWSKLLIMLIE
jgi:hypothetical protein